MVGVLPAVLRSGEPSASCVEMEALANHLFADSRPERELVLGSVAAMKPDEARPGTVGVQLSYEMIQ